MPRPHRPALLALAAALGSALFLTLALLSGATPAARADGAAPCYGSGTFPVFMGIPPWGYHTGASLASNATRGSYARAQGDINLNTGRISGDICQVDVRHGVDDQILLHPVSPIIFHTHHAVMWGYPGNEVKTHVRVFTSDDASCKVGTVGLMTMYASYNNVRSDSIQFRFPAACASHDHLYHGSQVDAQVPPL